MVDKIKAQNETSITSQIHKNLLQCSNPVFEANHTRPPCWVIICQMILGNYNMNNTLFDKINTYLLEHDTTVHLTWIIL